MQLFTPLTLYLQQVFPQADNQLGLYLYPQNHWLVNTSQHPAVVDGMFSQSNIITELPAELAISTASLDRVYDLYQQHAIEAIPALLAEYQRALNSEGKIAIAVLITPPNPKAARYCNALYRLHNPQHQGAHSLSDWQFWMEMGEWQEVQIETYHQLQDVAQWIELSGLEDHLTIERLTAMLLHAPQEVAEWLSIQRHPHLSPYLGLRFRIPYGIITARKP